MNNLKFKLTKKEFISDINSEVYEYEHIKTKAKLIYIKNDETNKVFTIGFKTLPEDNAGAPHVTEHSVVSGSEKYPVKQPLMQLNKSSLNTFVNAMNSADKTIFPFSSPNNKDFMNMIGIYLDSVFCPNLTKTKEIFMQEGWHYELSNKQDKLSINGVVYNETKGSMSSTTRIMTEAINRSLFDNSYQYISSGIPDDIPNLTYEKLLEFYNKFYHPSNSLICLYGDCEIDKIMNFIDESYLSKFDYKYIDSAVKYATPLKSENKLVCSYSINEEDDIKNRTIFSKNYAVSTASDDVTGFAMNILQQVLVNSESSVIKRKLLENNLCGNVSAIYNNACIQPKFSILVQSTDEENIDQINEIIQSSIKDLADNGIDKKYLEACIANTVFNFKQTISNNCYSGLDLVLSLFNRWPSSDNPTEIFHFNKVIDSMYSMLESNGFEQLLKKYFIDNTFCSTVILKPQKGLARMKEKALEAKLQKYKEGLSDDELNDIIESCKKLKLRQETPDTEEALNTMPSLNLDDIEKEMAPKIVVEEKYDKYTLLHYNKFTNDLLYTQLLFDASALNKEEIKYCGLLSHILGKVSTKNYLLTDLSNELMIDTGEVSFSNTAYSDYNDKNITYKQFQVILKASTNKLKKAIELVNEILYNSMLNDSNRIKQILGMIISTMQDDFIMDGDRYAMKRLSSKLDEGDNYIDQTSGYGLYEFVKSLYDNFDSLKDEIILHLNEVLHKLLNSAHLIITTICDEEQKNTLKSYLPIINDKLDDTKKSHAGIDGFKYDDTKEAFSIAANAQYVSMGYSYNRLGYNFSGSLKVAETIMLTEYLWNNIRVIGGAYDVMANFKENGQLILATYRDPNLDRTIESFRKLPEYLANNSFNNDDMTKYIIGAIRNLDEPLSVEEEGDAVFKRYISHNTNENQQLIREQILNTTGQDISKCIPLIKAVIDKNVYNVLGSDEVIKGSKLPFDSIINI